MTKPTEVRSQAATQVATAQQQGEALRLMDEAVKAKYEERYDDALRAAADARHADPQVRGVGIVSSEIALRRGDPEKSQREALAALRQGDSAADANYLLAIAAWISRGGGKQSEQAGTMATHYLDEACLADFSNSDVRCYLGDVQRVLGLPALALRSLQAGVYRLSPWMSSQILSGKIQLANDEAGSGGQSAEVASLSGDRALLALRSALRSGQDPRATLDDVSACFTGQQIKILLADPALAAPGKAASTVLSEARKSLRQALPGAAKHPL
jgi:hypothetical protein